jgi:hypothetical protein
MIKTFRGLIRQRVKLRDVAQLKWALAAIGQSELCLQGLAEASQHALHDEHRV